MMLLYPLFCCGRQGNGGFLVCRPQPVPLLVEVPPSVSGNDSDLEDLRPQHPDPALLNG